MKNIKCILMIFTLFVLWSCENEETDFEDFGQTTCYFPYQSPVRTLVLGKYYQGFNDNDNNHRFEIGAVMGGVYSNKEVRKIHFEVNNNLLNDVSNVQALPEAYYEIETQSPVSIELGSVKGIISVQLKDAFFEDDLSFFPVKDSVNYVIPLEITEASNIDSILLGSPADGITNPSIADVTDWEVLPKFYTLFGIKYINKYHGHYLRRGVDVMNDGTTSVENIYRDDYVERDELILVSTSGKNKVTLSNRVRRGELESPGDVIMELAFNDDEECIISSAEGDSYSITGTGEFVENGDSWGGEEHDVLYLDYSYIDTANNETHQVNDTLVIRDRNVVFEEFPIIAKE